jgi:adenine phosphoribosyltransferase
MTITAESLTYTMTLGNVMRELPLVRPTPNTRLPLVELLGDVELTHAAAQEIQKRLPERTEMLFTCETSSIPLVHTLSELTGLPYDVARKRRRPYMDDPLIQDVASMTMGVGETLWLAHSHAQKLRGKQVAVVLDVVSSGGTVGALEKLVVRAGGTVCGRLAVFSQGRPRIEVVTLQELPIFDLAK